MRRRLLVTAVAALALTSGLALTAASAVSASSGGTIKVVYQIQGNNPALVVLMHTATTEFQKAYPGWTVALEPITSPAENDYYTKLDLMNQSA